MLMLMKISKRGAHQNAAAIQHYIPSPTFYYDQPHISINLSIVSYKSIIKSGNDKLSNTFMAYKELDHSAKNLGDYLMIVLPVIHLLKKILASLSNHATLIVIK